MESLEQRVATCMPNLDKTDLKLLVTYMENNRNEWSDDNVCEGAKKLLKKAISRADRKKYFIFGIFITMILNILGIIIAFVALYDNTTVDVPEIAKSLN